MDMIFYILAIGALTLFFSLWGLWCERKEKKEKSITVYLHENDIGYMYPEEQTEDGTRVRHPSHISDDCLNPECPQYGRCGGECLETLWEQRPPTDFLERRNKCIGEVVDQEPEPPDWVMRDG